jgi:hypothetical protein
MLSLFLPFLYGHMHFILVVSHSLDYQPSLMDWVVTGKHQTRNGCQAKI